MTSTADMLDALLDYSEVLDYMLDAYWSAWNRGDIAGQSYWRDRLRDEGVMP